MSDRYFTLAEIKAAAKAHSYKLGECIDASGKKACPGNPLNKKVDYWLTNTVSEFTKRPETAHGTYYVNLYSDTRKQTAPRSFPILVGKPVNGNTPPQAPVIIQMPENKNTPVKLSEDRLSLDNFMAMQKQISDLQAKNAELAYRNGILESENSTLKENEEEHLSESKNNDIFTMALPILDKFMDSQKESRALKFMELSERNPEYKQYANLFLPGQNRQQPGTAQQQSQSNAEFQQQIKKANDYIDSLPDEEFKCVEGLHAEFKKTGSRDILQFFELIRVNYPEIHAGLYKHLYGEEEQ